MDDAIDQRIVGKPDQPDPGALVAELERIRGCHHPGHAHGFAAGGQLVHSREPLRTTGRRLLPVWKFLTEADRPQNGPAPDPEQAEILRGCILHRHAAAVPAQGDIVPPRLDTGDHQQFLPVAEHQVMQPELRGLCPVNAPGCPDPVARAEKLSRQAPALQNVRIAGLQRPIRVLARLCNANRQQHMGIAPVNVEQFTLDFDDLVGVDGEGMVGSGDRQRERERQPGQNACGGAPRLPHGFSAPVAQHSSLPDHF